MTSNSTLPIGLRLADIACSFRAPCVPPGVIHCAKLHLLDALGVALAASSLGTRPRIEQAVTRLGSGEEATGIGVVERMPAPAAALLNGSLMHSLEFDDTHMASVIHASAVVAPTVLAIAEREHRRGDELLTAYVLGWEILARIGLTSPSAFHARGFQSTAVAGAPVAALLAASLSGLDRAACANALGIAGSQASGIFEFLSDGSTVKMLHGGWPAHAGIMASALAAAGMTGPATVFEGRRGLFNAFTDAPQSGQGFADSLDTFGERWLITEAAFKPYPCCHYLQAALECTEKLLLEVDVNDIAQVHCELPQEVAWLVCEPWAEKLNPRSGHVAKFSLPYCLAALIMDGELDVTTFDRATPDPRLHTMMSRIRFRAMENSGFPQRYPARVRIHTHEGRIIEADVMDVLGSNARPFTDAQVHEKFARNAARLLTVQALQTVKEEVLRLDQATHPDALMSALRCLRTTGNR